MGQPNRVKRDYSDVKSESVPAELKHLSKRRRREKILISPVAASEKETVQTIFFARKIWG